MMMKLTPRCHNFTNMHSQTVYFVFQQHLRTTLCPTLLLETTRMYTIEHSMPGVHNSNFMAVLNIFLAIPKGQNDLLLPIQSVHLSIKHSISTQFWAKRAKLKSSAGHIWPARRLLFMSALCHVPKNVT